MAGWHKTSRHVRGYGAGWDRTRARILDRDKHLCQVCLKAGRYTPATEVDHIKPKAQGGTDDDDNLQAIDKVCHAAKTEDEAAVAQGRRIKPKFDEDGRPIW
jgi:5-methylcytosine-specific restriction protein A